MKQTAIRTSNHDYRGNVAQNVTLKTFVLKALLNMLMI